MSNLIPFIEEKIEKWNNFLHIAKEEGDENRVKLISNIINDLKNILLAAQ